MTDVDTIPKLVKRARDAYGEGRVALRRKHFGIWEEQSWEDHYQAVKRFCLGLTDLGLRPGDRVIIIGDNDIEYYQAEYAVQAAGGVVVPFYSDAGPTEIEFTAGHCGASFVVAHDQEQVDKILKIKDRLPSLKKLVYWDERGLWNYTDNLLVKWEEVVCLGRKHEDDHGPVFEQFVARGTGDQLALIMYTSGSTGIPKGAMITHRNLLFAVSCYLESQGLTKRDQYFSYMSPAWITEQIYGVAGGPYFGMAVNFAEKAETVQQDIREIGPTVIFYGSRLWESIASTIQVKIADSGRLKRFIYRACLPIGRRMFGLKLAGEKPGFWLRVAHRWATWALFQPLLDKLGLSRVRLAYTGGTLLSPESFNFIGSLGLPLRQAYGSTEAGVVTGHNSHVKSHTLGGPPPGVDLRLKSGEIVVRSPGVFSGYYRDSHQTAKALRDGWFHTGDAGFLDEDGHLIFIDRVSELMELANGERFSPQFIESALRFSPYIRDAMVLGGKDRPYISSVVVIDYANVGKWADDLKATYTTFTDLSQKRDVYRLIRGEIEKVNAILPPGVEIKKFVSLHKEFDADEAELTRTRKLRRLFLEDRYQQLVDAIYSGSRSFQAEARVRYRDGRTGKVTTDVTIESLD
jgi:long-chain acyl-CoA synthetase